MRLLTLSSLAFFALTSVARADPFQEITVGVPVPSLSEAERWYAKFFGTDTEVIRPAPGVVEFKVAPGVWFQLFEADTQQSQGAVVRYQVDDMAAAQTARADAGITTGEAIEIPGVVTYSEFSDPFGNALGFYALPKAGPQQ